MSDSAFFMAGSLFTTDYLKQAIRADPAYLAIDVDSLRAKLDAIAAPFPKTSQTIESQTEDDFIWPVLSALGWSESLRQQNLTVSGRDDVPDGLLFASTETKAAANAQGDQWKRYAHGLAVVERKRWARPLDRASGRDEATAPSTQMLRYLRRIDVVAEGKLQWGILTNGTKWRLYWAGARSVSEEFLEIDLGRVLGLGDGDLFADEATRDHWLRVFAALFCRTAFIKDGADNRSFHERARAEAAWYEERVAASLSKLVFEQVFPSLATAIADAAPDAPLQDVREADDPGQPPDNARQSAAQTAPKAPPTASDPETAPGVSLCDAVPVPLPPNDLAASDFSSRIQNHIKARLARQTCSELP